MGETLTAGTSPSDDDNGLSNVTGSCLWLAEDAGFSWAASASYKLKDSEKCNAIKPTASFIDDEDNAERLTSEATSAIKAAMTLDDPADGSYGILELLAQGADVSSVRFELS